MAETRGVLLPAYVVADESASMGPYHQDLSGGLASLCNGLRAEPMIAAKVRLAILGFSDDVRVRQGMSDMRTVDRLPQLEVRGATNYGAAFGDLLQRIPYDVQMMKNDGYKVHRPVVFFLSDGQPTDGQHWRGPHGTLVDRNALPVAPNIIACGVGSARADTMLEVATRQEFAFVALPSADIGTAIAEFFHALTASLVASGRAMADGNPTLVVNRPDQFRLAVDVV
ncbi:vWA domain-containing protein [Nonomuraea sediminis]|uniref:vWA domain-containing protein n=1 Tax=Nonomuraea sediminis TaxID=2835864 RepID=UPI001BDC61F8|nr:VWA domain-containing protein [Nonomuraea sediminis]